jgi:hypothetical protein
MFMGMDTASPYSGWIQVSDITGLGTNYPLLLNPNGGNVGVGTTSPSYLLDVRANVAAASTPSVTLRLNNQLDGGHRILFSNAAAATLAAIDGDIESSGAGTDDGILKFWTATNGSMTEKMRIDKSGNVGIGTVSPNRKLQIGDVTLDANSDQAATLIVSGGITVRGGNWLSFDNAYTVHARMRWDGVNTAAEIAMKLDSYYGFDFQTRSGNSKMVIRGDSGNVGIGTTSPANSSKLDVTDGKIRAGTLTSTNGSTIIEGAYSNGAITTFGTEYSSGGPVLGYGVTPSTANADSFFSSTGINANRGAYVMAGGVHKWSSATAASIVAIGTVVSLVETMRLTTTGDVGIGTTTPAAKLDVRGSILVGTGSVTNTMGATNYIAISTPTIGQSTGLEFFASAAPYNPRAWITHTHSVSSQALTFNSTFGSGTGYANFIFSNGNVGIGTTSPAHKLDVIGTARIGQNSNSSTAAQLDITSGGDGFDALIDFGYWNTFDAGIWKIGRKGSLGSFIISNYSSGPEVNVVTINTSNNVGIGTTSPGSTLHIQGNVSASSYTSSISNGVGYFGTASYAVSASISLTATTAINATSASYATYAETSPVPPPLRPFYAATLGGF